ncbi:MAG: hypothetical protein KJZ75_16200 [Hyphomonadaceae bacterium]|mgnify:CR=1 FL=1|nr:hypothetical protein [Hyphomonadaceae bacterium]GIK50149.1 MAG: hypothetical protein BroJett013_28460 [Alphaproteobacteria bacterium]
MIVWSKGLGKQRLPLDLGAAELSVESDYLKMTGVIEPVCWNYAIRLGVTDIAAFLKFMSRPMTARYLAQREGLLGPLVLGLLRQAPRLIVVTIAAHFSRDRHKGGEDALLV